MSGDGIVGVVGAGTIGASWAALFLAAGRLVVVVDRDAGQRDRLPAAIAGSADSLVRLGMADPRDRLDALSVSATSDVLETVAFVQENGPENLEVKRALIAELDGVLAPDVPIASSTSGLMPSDLQAESCLPGRVIVGHPFNPPHLLPLVEIVAGTRTDPETVARADAFYRSVGKQPIILRKEVEGHVATRLVAAVWKEAVYLVEQGVCDIANIDRAIVGGPGPRWAALGQGLSYHLGGGEGGLARFLEAFDGPVRNWWTALGEPELTDETKSRLVESVAAYESELGGRDAVVRLRDEAVIEILRTRKNLTPDGA